MFSNIKRRGFALAVGVLLLMGGVHGSAAASDYPSKPITILIGFAPGGTQDIVARIIAEPLSKKLGVPVVVDNRPGAQAAIAMNALAAAEPDGYVIGFGSQQSHAQLPALSSTLQYDPIKSFTPIMSLVSQQTVFMVHPGVPATSVAEFIDWAKSDTPRVLGSTSVGSSMHLIAEWLNKTAGTNFRHVAYRNRASLVTEFVSGQIPVMGDPVQSALPMLRENQARPIAVSSYDRASAIPETPTFRESGFPDIATDSWLALFGPAEMPADIVSKINTAIKEVVAEGEPAHKNLVDLGFVLLLEDPDATLDRVKRDSERFAELIKEFGIVAEPAQ